MRGKKRLERSKGSDLKLHENYGEHLVASINSEITINFPDENVAQIYFNSLIPEQSNISHHRSQIKLFLEKNSLKISISATDITAFRATVNSYINWIRIINGMVEITNKI
jgi:tRNA threonylcarbamoyladenosine modification (KEOPS) complex  Pcc1 subunit